MSQILDDTAPMAKLTGFSRAAGPANRRKTQKYSPHTISLDDLTNSLSTSVNDLAFDKQSDSQGSLLKLYGATSIDAGLDREERRSTRVSTNSLEANGSNASIPAKKVIKPAGGMASMFADIGKAAAAKRAAKLSQNDLAGDSALAKTVAPEPSVTKIKEFGSAGNISAAQVPPKAERVAEKPVQKPVEKAIEKLVQKPVEKAIEKPVQKPVEKAIEKPVQKPVEKAIEKPVQKPVEKAIEKPVQKPAEKPIEKPAQPKVSTPIQAKQQAAAQLLHKQLRHNHLRKNNHHSENMQPRQNYHHCQRHYQMSLHRYPSQS